MSVTYSDETLQAVVHKLAKKKLNTAKSFRGQDMKLVKQICDLVSNLVVHIAYAYSCHKVKKEYGILEDYQQDWPIRDMLKLHLKYTSEASRRSMTVAAAKQIEKVLSTEIN